MSGRYAVEIRPAVRKELADISALDRARILRKIATLGDDPRPSGVIKLAGMDDLWRIRAGNYRIVHMIEDEFGGRDGGPRRAPAPGYRGL